MEAMLVRVMLVTALYSFMDKSFVVPTTFSKAPTVPLMVRLACPLLTAKPRKGGTPVRLVVAVMDPGPALLPPPLPPPPPPGGLTTIGGLVPPPGGGGGMPEGGPLVNPCSLENWLTNPLAPTAWTAKKITSLVAASAI